MLEIMKKIAQTASERLNQVEFQLIGISQYLQYDADKC